MYYFIKILLVLWILSFTLLLHVQYQDPGPVGKCTLGSPTALHCRGTLDFILQSRDVTSYWITKSVGLSVTQVFRTLPYFSIVLLQELFDSNLLLALPFVKDKQWICSGVALELFSCYLSLVMFIQILAQLTQLLPSCHLVNFVTVNHWVFYM